MKIINKNNSIIVQAFLVLVSINFSSCKKWLEEKPYSLYSTETFYTSANQAKTALLGVYEPLSNTYNYGFYLSMVFDIDSDLGQMNGTGLNTNERVIAHYNITPAIPHVANFWTQEYSGINRANFVIQKIPQMDMFKNGTETEKAELKRLLGEAKFLRGLYYFDLVRLFGDVPLKLTPSDASDNTNIERTDRELVYDQIIKDLTDAIPDIPWNSNKVLDERVSKGAVKGILARVYLGRGGYSLRQDGTMKRPSNYKEYYAAALLQTKEIIESGEHSLNTSYENIFRNYCQLIQEPKESMFEVAFYNATGGPVNSGSIGTWNSPLCAVGSSYGRANSFYKSLPIFQKSYANGDLRRDVAIATFQITATNAIVQYSGTNDALWAPGKWRRNWQKIPAKDLNNTDINWVLLRYSDVLLMHAEAENELNEGPNASAYLAVNMVRRRGFGVSITEPSTAADVPAGLTKNQFLTMLQKERAFELCYEGFRKFDLIRWNILGTSLRDTEAALKAYRSNFGYVAGTYFKDNKHELLPIPAREIELNSKLTQNPNY